MPNHDELFPTFFLVVRPLRLCLASFVPNFPFCSREDDKGGPRLALFCWLNMLPDNARSGSVVGAPVKVFVSCKEVEAEKERR